MKKHGQIKIWVFMVIAVVVLGSIFYVVGGKIFSSFSSDSVNNESSSVGMGGVAFDSDMSYGEEKMMSPSIAVSVADQNVVDTRMMIKSGTVSLVVDDVNSSISDIVSYVEVKGGFLVTSNVDKFGESFSGYLTVRVPSENLDDTILYVKDMGEVESEHVDSSDITEEYIDLESELKNLRATESQFLEIMKRAVKIEDVLSVQRELGFVRGNIDRIEGRMKYLNQSVDLSSLTVYLSTNPAVIPVITEDKKWEPLVIFKDALRSLLATGRGVLNVLIWFGVYLPVFVVLVFVVWVVRRRFRGKGKKGRK